MNDLDCILAQVLENKSEVKKLAEIKSAAQAALAKVTDGDISSPAAKQVIEDSRLALALVSAREAKILPPLSPLYARLRAEFRAEGVRWNAAVEAARVAMEKAVIQANLVFWEGNEGAMRRTLGLTLYAAPVFESFRLAIFYFPSYQFQAEEDLPRDVRIFKEHCRRHRKNLGIA